MMGAIGFLSQADKAQAYNRFIRDLVVYQGTGHTVHAMAGIPGSGKSTFVQQCIADGRFPANAFVMNPDRVMESLEQYRETYASQGAETAFRTWEIPARELAYELLEAAIRLHLPLVIDMGGARTDHVDLLRRLKEREGYCLEMHWMDTDVQTALERTLKRERFTPAEMLIERAATLSGLRTSYEHLADRFFVHSS